MVIALPLRLELGRKSQAVGAVHSWISLSGGCNCNADASATTQPRSHAAPLHHSLFRFITPSHLETNPSVLACLMRLRGLTTCNSPGLLLACHAPPPHFAHLPVYRSCKSGAGNALLCICCVLAVDADADVLILLVAAAAACKLANHEPLGARFRIETHPSMPVDDSGSYSGLVAQRMRGELAFLHATQADHLCDRRAHGILMHGMLKSCFSYYRNGTYCRAVQTMQTAHHISQIVLPSFWEPVLIQT